MSLSKSKRKAARCPYYYKHGRGVSFTDPMRDAGIDFHRYKQEYVNHLIATGKRSDPEWALSWLAASGVCEEARPMIEWDVQRFEIDPDIVVGTEQFLVADFDFQPIRGVPFPGYGKDPEVVGLAHGTLDLILMPDDSTVVAEDYKTGWSPYVDKEEAEHYAALLFAHFPEAQTVIFHWVQTRINSEDVMTFTRDQLPALQRAILNAEARLAAIEADPTPKTNPFSGNCAWCVLECPVRRSLPFGPPQNQQDLNQIMGYVESTEHQLRRARDMARSYLLEAGPTPVGDGEKQAQITTQERLEFPLASTLRALDIEVPERSEAWDIDLDKLKISASDLQRLAGTKKRAGLQEALAPAAKVKLWRELEVV